MGNVLLEGSRRGVDPAEEYQRWLEENPDLVGKQILGENKLFRTSSYKFNSRNIILKVFFKRDPAPLVDYLKIFEFFNQLTEKHKTTNISALKLFNDKDNQSFVVAYRQKMYSTLQEILSAKPAPTQAKKKWMIYQMIRAVHVVHKLFHFYHGNIRTSNFVSTTYGYLLLTDFAFYKPIYMFQDTQQGLPEFRLFYGSSVNNCTLAPQKITDQNNLKNNERSPARLFANYQPPQQTSSSFSLNLQSMNASVLETMSTSVIGETSVIPVNLTPTDSIYDPQFIKQRSLDETGKNYNSYQEQMRNLQKMDIFSLGCSILQVLRDGKPLMNFQTYLKFKKGQVSFDSIIDDACKNIEHGEQINKIIKSMLELNPQNRPNIEDIMNDYNKIINMDTYSLIWHCTSTFSTTSFLLPDFRIALIHSIFKFIEVEERGIVHDYKIQLPKCFKFFEPLKIFKSILKNKIVYSAFIPQNSILKRILDSNEKQDIVDSEEEQIMNEEGDARKQFFVPLVAKRKQSSLRTSTAAIPKLQKVLCPPEWNRDLLKLVETKYKGNKLTSHEILKNRFQDLLESYKKSQGIRQIRIKQNSQFYNQYNMVIRLIFSCIRSCKYNSSKLMGIELMLLIAKQSADSVKLTKMIPRLISLLDDPDSMTSRYAFNSIIDVFYMFIDPFHNEQDTHYYEIIIEMLINCIKTGRLRVSLFRRLGEIYSICQWLQVHIRKICNKIQTKVSLKNFVEAIKSNFGSYFPHEIRELMMGIPDIMWPDMFEFFISFLNSEKILGLEKSICIAEIDTELHKKIIDVIDSCVESELDENGISLYYAIKYFTKRKVCTTVIVKKIALMVIHPHLWVREQAKQYLYMCLEENPPARIFFLLRQVYEPPFPLQPKDIIDDILLPSPLLESEVDFSKRIIKQPRKIGLTQKLFLDYLQKVKSSKSYPTTKENQSAEWNMNARSLIQQKVQPTQFHNYIKKSIYELFEANFLYYVGNAKSPFKYYQKQEDKRKVYEELHDALKKLGITSLDDNQMAYEKKDFLVSLSTIVSTFSQNRFQFREAFDKIHKGRQNKQDKNK